jgi:hypothetical protein
MDMPPACKTLLASNAKYVIRVIAIGGYAYANVLQFCQTSNTITVRLPEQLAQWLSAVARKTGVPVGRIVREQLQRARSEQDRRPYMRLAGKIKGPRNLSTRKGFSRR